MTKIVCRGRLEGCLHGQSTKKQFGYDAELDEDGTFDGTSIVCDACYCRCIAASPSGMALNHELDETIAKLKAQS